MGRPLAPLALASLLVAACGDDGSSATPATSGVPAEAPVESAADSSSIDPGDDGDYSVAVDPARFTSTVDNPLLPKLRGTTWVYEARTPDDEVEVITVEVLDETRTVMGVETIVVHDVVETVDGELIEDTYDWFAQDVDGAVWYFGEETTAYEDGVASDSGAWEAGVDGALPGIVMQATPTPSETGYRQEYLRGEAEDMGMVLDVGNGFVVTRDWTPLEPDVVEEKTYVEGIGFVFESKTAGEGVGEQVVLVGFTTG